MMGGRVPPWEPDKKRGKGLVIKVGIALGRTSID